MTSDSPRNIRLAGADFEPTDPLWRHASAAARRGYWQHLATYALATKRASLAAGLGSNGRRLRRVKPSSRPDGATGPPLSPHDAASRTQRYLAVTPTATGATLFWRQGWRKILGYHAAGAGHLPVRDVVELSKADAGKIAREGRRWWAASQGMGVGGWGLGREKTGPGLHQPPTPISHPPSRVVYLPPGVPPRPISRQIQVAVGVEGGRGRGRPPATPAPKPAPPPKPKPRPAAAVIPPVPTFGLSKAKVALLSSRTAVQQATQAILGRKVSPADLASLMGAPDGAKALIGGLEVSPGVWVLALDFEGPGYRANRYLRREAGKVVLKNDNFFIAESQQGQGLGTQVFGRQVETAARLGVHEIRTHAAGDNNSTMNGYYTWPRFGYDAPIPGPLLSSVPPALGNATKVSELMKSKEGREWWRTHGRDLFVATFDLKKDSLSRQVWEGYLAEKARARAESKSPTSPRPT